MKIRNDFVTNSSSSSFILQFGINLTNGETLTFEANGFEEDCGFYFGLDDEIDIDLMSPEEIIQHIKNNNLYDGELETVEDLDRIANDFGTLSYDAYYFLNVVKSPRELGCSKTVANLIKKIKDSILVDDYEEDAPRVFKNPKDIDVILFMYKLSKIKSMDEIESIYVSGDEENYMEYNRYFEYNLKTKEYTGRVEGCEFEKDGGSGGDFTFSDTNKANIVYDDEYDEDEEE